jgi:hypothetical protein
MYPFAARAHSVAVTVFYLLVWFICSCHAQTTGNEWQWQFIDSGYATSLPTCQSLPILAKSRAADNSTGSGKPPYYMRALAVGGIPRVYDIGSDNANLHWTVDFKPGTQLMLSVIDANGTAGGIPPRLYTSVAGQNTNCVKEDSKGTEFTITANVTGTLNTCDPWGITLTGGAPPYMFSLAALNSAFVTNVSTQADGEDSLTYINRADPGNQLLVTASDVTGRFAMGSPIITTAGSEDNQCTGLVTTVGNSSQLRREQEARDDAAAKKDKRKRIAIAVPVSIIGALLLLGGFFLYRFLKRRRRRLMGTDVDAAPRKFDALSAGGTTSSMPYTTEPSIAGSAATPMSPTNTRRKASTMTARSDNAPTSPDANGLDLPLTRSPDGELYIQHHDGGVDVVRELPPPYASSSRPRAPAPPVVKGQSQGLALSSP